VSNDVRSVDRRAKEDVTSNVTTTFPERKLAIEEVCSQICVSKSPLPLLPVNLPKMFLRKYVVNGAGATRARFQRKNRGHPQCEICTQYVLRALLCQPSLQFSWRPAALTTAPLQALGNKKTQALSHESVFVPEGASAPEGGNFKPKKDGW